MFIFESTINKLDNVFLFINNMITIIEIDFLHDVYAKNFKYFDNLI